MKLIVDEQFEEAQSVERQMLSTSLLGSASIGQDRDPSRIPGQFVNCQQLRLLVLLAQGLFQGGRWLVVDDFVIVYQRQGMDNADQHRLMPEIRKSRREPVGGFASGDRYCAESQEQGNGSEAPPSLRC